MLNRHVNQAARDPDCGAIPVSKVGVPVALPIRGKPSPYDLEPGFEFLRSLIESRVIERLEQIFEQLRRHEALGTYKAERRPVRLREVLSMLGGIGKSTLYARINPASPSYDPEMPKPFKLGKGKNAKRAPSAWWDTDVKAYLETCAQTRT